jgi:hypothetical protein
MSQPQDKSNDGLIEAISGIIFFIYLLNVIDLKTFGYAVIIALIPLFFYAVLTMALTVYAIRQFKDWFENRSINTGKNLKWTIIGILLCALVYYLLPFK